MRFLCRMKGKARKHTNFDKCAQTNFYLNLRAFALPVFFCILFSSINITAQNFPKEIRGYKVYQAKISVKNRTEKKEASNGSETYVKIGEPEIADASLAGITLAVSAEIESATQSGIIDFLAFQDFRVNNLTVDVEEYKESFRLEKNKLITLPKPVKIFLGVRQTLRGAFNELKNSKEEWTVTGRVFVFGRFKKSFLKFKRVVPIEINFKIKNPLRNSSEK